MKLATAEKTSKEYLGEIRRPIREIDCAVRKDQPATTINVKKEYKEQK